MKSILCGWRQGCLWLSLVTLPLAVAGCITVGPDYVAPASSFPAAWSGAAEAGAVGAGSPVRSARWWQVLNDPGLDALLERALAGNLDLKTAQSRLRQSRASLSISRAGQFPDLGGSASATRRRSAENSGGGDVSTAYSAGLDSSWELDIFGGTRRAVEAAQAGLEAVAAGLDDVMVSLQAEVVLTYGESCILQERLALARTSLRSREENLALVAARQAAGLLDESALNDARAAIENARVQVPQLEAEYAAALNRLAILLGEYPGGLTGETIGALPLIPAEILVGIPAAVLRNRPDVRAAERELAAQSARIGEATADLYPKLTLAGSAGLSSPKFKELGQTYSRGYSFGPQLSWALFSAGAIRQNIRVQDELYEQALSNYHKTVLNAAAEVEDALKAYAAGGARLVSLTEVEAERCESAELQQLKYAAGLAGYDEVLAARLEMLTARDQRIQARSEQFSEFVSLYKALGGGWSVEPGTDDERES